MFPLPQHSLWKKPRNVTALVFAAGLLFALVFPVPPVSAQLGSLLVAPKRVIFEKRKRAAEVVVVNRGSQTTTYRIGFKNMRMTEPGGVEDITEPGPGDRFAESYIRYSPRQVVLEPGVPQTVRLLLRKPRDLEPGEYRSHMVFTSLPSEGAGQDIESLAVKEGEVKVRIVPIYGISIPVIVRNGDLSASGSLTEISLEKKESPDAKQALSMRLNRKGDASLFGDIEVKYIPEKGDEMVVGIVRGIALYTPNASRLVSIDLVPPEGVTLKGGKLHISYTTQPDEGIRMIAEADIPIP